MYTVNDGAVAPCYSPWASEMRPAVAWDRPSNQEPGAAVRDLDRSADRPSERRCRGADCGEAGLRYPARSVEWPPKRRAAGGDGRAGRLSCPAPELWSWPPGASLDALPLLHTLGRLAA